MVITLGGVLLTLVGCGDGIGRPLVVDDQAEVSDGGLTHGVSEGGANGALDGDNEAPDTNSTNYCDTTQDWPQGAVATEQVIATGLDVVRGLGVSCDGTPLGTAAPELRIEPELVCAARLHARDMVERDFFAHINPDGEDAEARLRSTGYVFGVVGEVIGRGALVDLVLQDGEDCRAVVDTAFEAAGIGVYEDLWTIVLVDR